MDFQLEEHIINSSKAEKTGTTYNAGSCPDNTNLATNGSIAKAYADLKDSLKFNFNSYWHTAGNYKPYWFYYEQANTSQYYLPANCCIIQVFKNGNNRGVAIAYQWTNGGGGRLWLNNLHDDTGGNRWSGWQTVFSS